MILIPFTIKMNIILSFSEENPNQVPKMSDQLNKEQIKKMINEKIQTLQGIEAQVPASFRELRGKWNQTAETYMEISPLIQMMEMNYNREMEAEASRVTQEALDFFKETTDKLSKNNKDKDAANKRRTLDEKLNASFNNRMAKMARWEPLEPRNPNATSQDTPVQPMPRYTTSQKQDTPITPMPRYTARKNQDTNVTPMPRYTASQNQDSRTQVTAHWEPMEPPTRYSPGTPSKQAAHLNTANIEREPFGTMIMTANPDTPMIYLNVKGYYYKIPMNQCTDNLKTKLIEAVDTGKLDYSIADLWTENRRRAKTILILEYIRAELTQWKPSEFWKERELLRVRIQELNKLIKREEDM